MEPKPCWQCFEVHCRRSGDRRPMVARPARPHLVFRARSVSPGRQHEHRLFSLGAGDMTEIQNRIVGVVGRKGSGKSTRVQVLLRYCPRFVVFDVMAEHSRENGNRLESCAQLAEFLKWSREQRTFAGCYVPSSELDEEIEEVA